MSGSLKVFKQDEISKHTSKNDVWIIVHGRVYDVTKYLEDHPGGAASLLEVAGQDATATFEDVGHSADARETMVEYLVGRMDGADEDDELEVPPKDLPRLVRIAKQDTPAVIKPFSSKLGQSLLKLIIGSGSALLIYEAMARLPSVGWMHHQHGGFWRGFLIASVAGISATTAMFLWISRNMPNQHTMASWPAHYKPAIVSKPITQAVGFLKPQDYQKLPLIRKDKLSSNSYRLVFKLPKENSILGLPIGQHVSIRADINGKLVSRSYTPVSNNTDPGELRLVIKTYPDGELTGKYISKLRVGDEVEFRGPKGAMRYRRGLADDIGMIAGGTGITPMYQLIRAICEDARDKTRVKLIYGSTSEEEILLRGQLDAFAEKYPDNFEVTYVLSSPGEDWKGAKGYVTKDMVKETFAGPEGKNKVMLCGPPPLVNSMKTALEELGYEKPGAVSKLGDQVFCF